MERYEFFRLPAFERLRQKKAFVLRHASGAIRSSRLVIIDTLIEAGADALEQVSLFSDPLADVA